MTGGDSITHWIEQIRANDPAVRDEAADQIWRRYSGRLLQLARNHLDQRIRRREDEDDVVQNMYASFCCRMRRGEDQLENRQDLWNLLVAMTLHKARKVALRHTRQGRAVRREDACPAGDESDSLVKRLPAPDPTPEEAAELAEGVELLLRALPNPILRQVALWKLEGYTSEDIAAPDKLDCAERTVERKLRLIREIWEQIDL